MAKIKVSASVPEQRELTQCDSTGETWVLIRPPGWSEEKRRGRMLSNAEMYFVDGMPATRVDVNQRELWELEIWLTYEDTNMVVEIENEDGDIEEISFKPRGQITAVEFVENLSKLPPSIVQEWRSAVVDVVPAWFYPF